MIEYTHPDVLRDSPDPADPTTIDWPARQVRALIPFEVYKGRPICPEDWTVVEGKRGRNGLPLWGENPMADALVACEYAGRHWVLLVQRRDNGTWAMPGGSIEWSDGPVSVATHQCKIQTGLDLLNGGLYDWSKCNPDPPRWVPDPRGSMEAWAVTVVTRFNLGTVDALPEVRGGDDAQRARWVPAEPWTWNSPIFPAHREILAGLR